MSANDYAQQSTDALLERFREIAARLGTAWGNASKFQMLPPAVRTELIKEMHAIRAEIVVRKPIAKLRVLFEDEDPDIRSMAALQFDSVDPEWGSAALSGLTVRPRLTTRETLALKRRALEPPPARPTLKEMSDEELIARFEDAALREHGAQFIPDENGNPDVEARNPIVRELMGIKKEIASRNLLPKLFPLLDHPYDTVRSDAAWASLDLVPERAVPILEAIVESGGYYNLSYAAQALEAWRKKNAPQN
jgi:hypothetical protein